MTVEAAGQNLTRAGDCEPRRFVALWWDAVANQLGWSDGLRRGVGQLDRQVSSAWLHAGGLLGLVGAWLVEHEVFLDGDGFAPPRPSESSGTGSLVDGAQNRAWVVVRGLARVMVRRQQLEPTEAELSELDKLANDPSLSDFYF
jgi:hypothetical protein